MIKEWFKSGSPWVWLTASAVSVSLILVFGLLLLIAARGLGHFWPATVWEFDYQNQSGDVVRLAGEIHDDELVGVERLRDAGIDVTGDGEVTRYLLKTGNRDVSGQDFRWIVDPKIQQRGTPETLMVVERREWGNLYGYLNAVQENQQSIDVGGDAWESLQQRLVRVNKIFAEIRQLEKGEIGAINYGLERLRLRERALELKGDADPVKAGEIKEERTAFNAEYEGLQKQLIETVNRSVCSD
jgi:phosphate transport system permease protein